MENLYLLPAVRDEVPRLSVQDCHKVGLEFVCASEDVKKMAEETYGGLSETDRLNLFTAMELKFELATNDNELREAYKKVT